MPVNFLSRIIHDMFPWPASQHHITELDNRSIGHRLCLDYRNTFASLGLFAEVELRHSLSQFLGIYPYVERGDISGCGNIDGGISKEFSMIEIQVNLEGTLLDDGRHEIRQGIDG